MHCKLTAIWSLPVEYRVYRKLGEGTFSEVLKAESVKTRQKVAIKCMKSYFDNIEKVRALVLTMLGSKFTRN
jgi:serine/threonine protein kinase